MKEVFDEINSLTTKPYVKMKGKCETKDKKLYHRFRCLKIYLMSVLWFDILIRKNY